MPLERCAEVKRVLRENRSPSLRQIVNHHRDIAFARPHPVNNQAPAAIRQPVAFRAFHTLQTFHRRNVRLFKHACQPRPAVDLDVIEHGRNTYWAPEVLWHGGKYHMFVSYITGVPTSWVGDRTILHYTSDNLWDWKYEHAVPLPSRRVIDACVHPLPGGGWRLWYKDEADHSHTHYADSPDLFAWEHRGIATQDQAQEGPNVFALGGRYWMIADIWDGQAVYASDDLTRWVRQEGAIMSGAGLRQEDGNRAHHADVLVVDDHAYMFYFVHPGQQEADNLDGLGHPNPRRSSLQAAELKIIDGRLVSLRDEAFDFFLPDMQE